MVAVREGKIISFEVTDALIPRNDTAMGFA
jgi:hypothetical protein